MQKCVLNDGDCSHPGRHKHRDYLGMVVAGQMLVSYLVADF
jgi:hypothetical protein